MTVTLKDTMIFVSEDSDPILGTLSYEKPFTPNTALTVKDGNKTTTLLATQIKLAIFKATSNEFGFIFKNALYSDKNFDYWNNETLRIAGRELKACFAD